MSTFPLRAEVKSMGTRSTRTGLGETPSSPPHERADTTPASRRLRKGVLTRSTIKAAGSQSSRGAGVNELRRIQVRESWQLTVTYAGPGRIGLPKQIGRASCRERVQGAVGA